MLSNVLSCFITLFYPVVCKDIELNPISFNMPKWHVHSYITAVFDTEAGGI